MNTRRRFSPGKGIAFAALLLAALAVFAATRGTGDVSGVTIEYGGHEMVNGQQQIVLLVHNRSGYRISVPVDYEIRGEAPDGSAFVPDHFVDFSNSMDLMMFDVDPPWWRFGLRWIPSIAPGETYRYLVPVEAGPYTWHVTLRLWTIPFRERLPDRLQSLWPESARDAPIEFEVKSPAIPPPQIATEPGAVIAVDDP